MSGAFGMAADWLEDGTPEAQQLGAEIFDLLDGFVAAGAGAWIAAELEPLLFGPTEPQEERP